MFENLKIGKAPAVEDHRNIKMATILNVAAIAYPASFDTDAHLGTTIPLSMFGNDEYGDCVIVGRANQTLRFEMFEQKKILPITTDNVLHEYWKEEGGTGPTYDRGLVMLNSLKEWRNTGWALSDGKTYTIYAFAQIDYRDQKEVKAAVYYLNGIMTGLALPETAGTQFGKGQIWDVVSGPGSAVGSWGGHCVYVCGYNATGPICITWAKKQQMTWRFFSKYCDEAYGIIDNKDKWVANDPLNCSALQNYLNQIVKL
jgi:hypothetical protein